jgi:glycyl-tRNA synthetase beta chain
MLKKVQALEIILENSNYEELFGNAKRVSNILKKSNLTLSSNIEENLLRESSEKILYNAINNITDELNLALEKNNYAEYLEKLNTLNPYVKIFFDEVMINTNEENIKLNRLSLLDSINNFYTNVANISILSH